MANEFQLIRVADTRGQMHEFQVVPLGTPFVERAGLYVFCAPIAQGNWNALYVGQAHNLQERVGTGLANHHKFRSALVAGATHIAVRLFDGTEDQRISVEASLIAALNPPLNGAGHTQFRRLGF